MSRTVRVIMVNMREVLLLTDSSATSIHSDEHWIRVEEAETTLFCAPREQVFLVELLPAED